MQHYQQAFEAAKNAYEFIHPLRANSFQQFLEQGFPTRKMEAWRYTDMHSLASQSYQQPIARHEVELDKTLLLDDHPRIVFVDGYFNPQLSTHVGLAPEVVICPMKEALQYYPELVNLCLTRAYSDQNAFEHLNLALLTDGLFCYVPRSVQVDTVIHILFLSAQTNVMWHARNLITLEESSRAKLFLDFQGSGSGFVNIVNQIMLDNHANLQLYQLQNTSLMTRCISHTRVELHQASELTAFSVQVGAELARDDVTVNLVEEHASCEISGLYLPKLKQHLDQQVHVHHRAPNTNSRIEYKGILKDEGHAVFNGQIIVYPQSQKTDAHLSNHNLMLSEQAQVDTLPQLEIYADDVKCSHGATVGELDADALFYLRSRGIDEVSAKALLTEAFARDILGKITDKQIVGRLTRACERADNQQQNSI